MKPRNGFLKSGACLLLLALLTGCVIPYPHTIERSWEICGRSLDARTHAPIQGAKIFLTAHPEISCISDAEGRFRLKATHNFHLATIGLGESQDWPHKEFWGCAITVTHPGYKSFVQRGRDGEWIADKGDILLSPGVKTEISR